MSEMSMAQALKHLEDAAVVMTGAQTRPAEVVRGDGSGSSSTIGRWPGSGTMAANSTSASTNSSAASAS